MPDLQLRVTKPASIVDGRAQSYRMTVEALLSGPLAGRWGNLDQHIFVLRTEGWGTINFLRVVEPRDLDLPLFGALRRSDVLELMLPAESLADELLTALLVDVRRLLDSHLETGIRIDESHP